MVVQVCQARGCLVIDAPDEVILERLLERGKVECGMGLPVGPSLPPPSSPFLTRSSRLFPAQTSGRIDDNPETIQKRLDVYHSTVRLLHQQSLPLASPCHSRCPSFVHATPPSCGFPCPQTVNVYDHFEESDRLVRVDGTAPKEAVFLKVKAAVDGLISRETTSSAPSVSPRAPSPLSAVEPAASH